MPANCDENPKLIQWRSLSGGRIVKQATIRSNLGHGLIERPGIMKRHSHQPTKIFYRLYGNVHHINWDIHLTSHGNSLGPNVGLSDGDNVGRILVSPETACTRDCTIRRMQRTAPSSDHRRWVRLRLWVCHYVTSGGLVGVLVCS